MSTYQEFKEVAREALRWARENKVMALGIAAAAAGTATVVAATVAAIAGYPIMPLGDAALSFAGGAFALHRAVRMSGPTL